MFWKTSVDTAWTRGGEVTDVDLRAMNTPLWRTTRGPSFGTTTEEELCRWPHGDFGFNKLGAGNTCGVLSNQGWRLQE